MAGHHAPGLYRDGERALSIAGRVAHATGLPRRGLRARSRAVAEPGDPDRRLAGDAAVLAADARARLSVVRDHHGLADDVRAARVRRRLCAAGVRVAGALWGRRDLVHRDRL